MADIDDIATRMANVILSPDSITGLIQGALTFPLDLGYMVYGVFDTDSRYRLETARIRMGYAIKHGIINHKRITHALGLIFNAFNNYVSEAEQDKIYRGVISSIIGRLSTNVIITKTAAAVLERVSFISASSSAKPIATISSILLLGGMIERSIRTSEHLEIEAPEVYQILRPRDYDLLYFLFAPSIQPFVDAIQVRVSQGEETFKRMLQKLEEKIKFA
ncbi:MAG: hypothetical protein P4L95_15675 [Rouxiella aceris]|jgi:hypothetical protein|uniref:hypothetical protein n=1 Tax=Rouxiella aceris TaxID=2703884 RepID=UPI00284AA2C8|nr:hypothetical protein [Rouxiella aceris]MDR3433319.1 hypothetical protein [Rouxiella aceris]